MQHRSSVHPVPIGSSPHLTIPLCFVLYSVLLLPMEIAGYCLFRKLTG